VAVDGAGALSPWPCAATGGAGLTNERRQRLINLIINGLRILATALATALFFRMLAQPSDQLLARALKEK